MVKYILSFFILILCVSGLSACSGSSERENVQHSYPIDPDDKRRLRNGKLTGNSGLKLLGGKDNSDSGSGGIGVNSFLWRATLDTLSFMPLSSVDPHGGVIITDWYENPDAPGEQFKMDVLILGKALRADGVRVSVFKRTLDENGQWRDSTVSPDVPEAMENKILTRARELRINNAV